MEENSKKEWDLIAEHFVQLYSQYDNLEAHETQIQQGNCVLVVDQITVWSSVGGCDWLRDHILVTSDSPYRVAGKCLLLAMISVSATLYQKLKYKKYVTWRLTDAVGMSKI